MNQWMTVIIGVCIGLPIAAMMKLNPVLSAMLCAGITALCIWIGAR